MKKGTIGIILNQGGPLNGVRARFLKMNLGGPLVELLEPVGTAYDIMAIVQLGAGEFQRTEETNSLLKSGGRSG